MMWALFSVLAGFFDSIFYSVLKKLSSLEVYSKLAFLNILALPFLAFGFLFYDIPEVTAAFYFVVFINIILFFLAQLLMIKSLKISNLSISVPMLSFTPVFLILTSYILLKELPTLIGFFGILLVVMGSYILNISGIKHGYLEPFRSIFKNKGIFYMVCVAFLYSLCANLGKIAIKLSNPAFYIFMFYFIYSILLFVVFFRDIKSHMHGLKKYLKYFTYCGLSNAASEILVSIALTFSIVPYIISLKRTSILFSVLIGIFIFREKNFRAAIIGSLIMFAGVLIITLPQ